jgi:LytR cell envelope-related transcriptional attenuator/Tetratricopeptide repeat
MRLKTLLLLTVAALPIVVAGCADSATEIRAKYGDSSWTAEELTSTPYERGKAHYAGGRFGLAVKQFEMALSQDPKSVEALNGLAASFDQLKRFELAERYYLRALTLEPDNAQTLNNLGYSYLMQGRYDLALANLQDAYRLDPMTPRVQDNLQQAQASLELENRDYLASAVGSAEFRDVMEPPRTVNMHTQTAEDPTPGKQDVPPLVQIQTVDPTDDIWVERSTAVVQSLITQPNPDLLDAMREAGLAPRVANFRNQAAVTTLQTQPAPWQTATLMIADATVEREQDGAIRRDQLDDDLTDTPLAAPTVAVETAELPRLSATFFEDAPGTELSDLPQLAAAIIDGGSDVDGRPLAEASVTRVDGSADGGIWNLPQLSAAVIEAVPSPGEGEGLPATGETPVVRQATAQGYEPHAPGLHASRRDDQPALPPGSDESPVIEVSNGTGRSEMAFRIGQFLDSEGLIVNRLTNAEHFRHQHTVIFYRREWLREAQELAACLPIEVSLVAAPGQKSDIRIRLGGDLLNFDQGLFYASRESSAKPTG